MIPFEDLFSDATNLVGVKSTAKRVARTHYRQVRFARRYHSAAGNYRTPV
jgi:hypothetical protein